MIKLKELNKIKTNAWKTRSSFVEAVFLALVEQVCLGATYKTNNENENENENEKTLSREPMCARKSEAEAEAEAEQAPERNELVKQREEQANARAPRLTILGQPSRSFSSSMQARQ